MTIKIDFFDSELSKLISNCDEYNWFTSKSLAQYWGEAQLKEDGFTPDGTYEVKQMQGVFFVFCKSEKKANHD